jgi:lactoylglutathione lyase
MAITISPAKALSFCYGCDNPCIKIDELNRVGQQLCTPYSLYNDGSFQMKYLHTMIRVSDPDATIRFFELLGLRELRRMDSEAGRFTLIFLAAPGDEDAQVELTHNWDEQGYGEGRNFGHLAYRVENVYETCRTLMNNGVTINRPPRDGRMAFVRTPDNISIELLQEGVALPPEEPWASMPNTGHW